MFFDLAVWSSWLILFIFVIVVFVKFEEIFYPGSFFVIIIVEESWAFLALFGGFGRLSLSNKGVSLDLFIGADSNSFRASGISS